MRIKVSNYHGRHVRLQNILRLANQATNIAYTNEKGMSKYREDKS